MEKKEVFVQVVGVQRDARGHEQTLEMATRGVYYEQDATYYLEYEEGLPGEDDFVKSEVKVQGDTVSVKRSGAQDSFFEFIKGKRCVNQYRTPYMTMETSVLPTRVAVDFAEAGGRLDLQYQLDINNLYIGVNELSIVFQVSP